MEKYIALNKRSKKQQKEYYSSRRGSWDGVKPYTRVFAEEGKFNKAQRSRDKAKLRKCDAGDAQGRPLFDWFHVYGDLT